VFFEHIFSFVEKNWENLGFFFLIINSTNYFSLRNFFQFFYIKNLQKRNKEKPWFGFFACHFFPQFCDVGEVVVIHKLIYTDLAIKT
jgi:hypothetical protein